ncbi:hypothetical protein KFY34_28825, partial [Salmonella enterica subsp. enterica serovar 1,4,[5],12:i:-]|nr:hypothetical protein [Salmonella enterica subsp. enterica serovar 1,4,[5],12:i:-]
GGPGVTLPHVGDGGATASDEGGLAAFPAVAVGLPAVVARRIAVTLCWNLNLIPTGKASHA